jgi:hypothetical protein
MAGYAGHAADARTPAEQSNLTFHRGENLLFSSADFEVVFPVS